LSGSARARWLPARLDAGAGANQFTESHGVLRPCTEKNRIEGGLRSSGERGLQARRPYPWATLPLQAASLLAAKLSC
jgi:hypothetical protein